ncbi:hypothetical protein K488DRAFT_83294 [Vararia minispora EC-137]|uniref:Uncharacterized protein n=1 Tax=Vararia minispora EC-137 TaxID=1314806 RepID=A0ACB8QUB0_9AGAM|nr:hypothetical protein K488DRAFT_83294 [Vararia minispora EC-137]
MSALPEFSVTSSDLSTKLEDASSVIDSPPASTIELESVAADQVTALPERTDGYQVPPNTEFNEDSSALQPQSVSQWAEQLSRFSSDGGTECFSPSQAQSSLSQSQSVIAQETSEDESHFSSSQEKSRCSSSQDSDPSHSRSPTPTNSQPRECQDEGLFRENSMKSVTSEGMPSSQERVASRSAAPWTPQQHNEEASRRQERMNGRMTKTLRQYDFDLTGVPTEREGRTQALLELAAELLRYLRRAHHGDAVKLRDDLDYAQMDVDAHLQYLLSEENVDIQNDLKCNVVTNPKTVLMENALRVISQLELQLSAPTEDIDLSSKRAVMVPLSMSQESRGPDSSSEPEDDV